MVRPGRTEREIDKDILALAARDFGVEAHWHKRIVRAGINTLSDFSDNPPIRTIGEDDMVFLDVGPVFSDWEADVGRSYAIGADPVKHALVKALPEQFAALQAHSRRMTTSPARNCTILPANQPRKPAGASAA